MFNRFDRHNRLTRRGTVASGAIAVGLLAALLVPGYGKTRVEAAPRLKQTVPAEEVSESPSEYLGQTITMRGEVAETDRYENSFLIDDDRFFGGENILVLNATGSPIQLPAEDIQVQVTGEVRQFTLADIEREFGWGLDTEYYAEFENQPAIVARSIALSPELEEILENPSIYYNQPLSIEGEVEEMRGMNAFTLSNNEFLGGEELLVINMAMGEPPEEGTQVVVAGQVRQATIADLEREYGFDWDAGLQSELEVEFEGQPVMVADGVFPQQVE